MNYIGIDLGTTAVKCALYRDDRAIADFNREYPLIADGAKVEQDANVWWQVICDGIRSVVRESGEREIAGISISSQGITLLPVDRNGTPLCRAISWLDTRATEETRIIGETVGKEELFRITGKPLLPVYSLPKLMWLKKYESALLRSADKVLLPLDWLNFQLCGKAVTDMSMASGTMLYDIEKREWNQNLLAMAGLREDQLPTVGEMGEDLGCVRPEVAEALGICKNARIYLGGQDQKLSAIGAGFGKTVATLSLGTSSAVEFASSIATGERAARFAFDRDTIVAEVPFNTTGAAVRWLKNALGFEKYSDMDRAAEEAGTAAGVCFEEVDFSSGAGISGMKLGTTRGNLAYALYEGIAREIGKCFSPDDGIEEIRVFGGGAHGSLWCKLIAEQSGKKVAVLQTNETAIHGAVMLASNRRVAPAKVERYI